MRTTKEFPTEIVLSAVGGRLLCDVGGLYAIYGFLLGTDVFTHQLPRAFRECRAPLIAQLPQLADYDDSSVTPENFREWRTAQIEKHGPTLAIAPLADAPDFTSPVGDLLEMMRGREDKALVVKVPNV